MLASNISDTDLSIPLLDASDFPNAGIIKIGAELVQYTSKSFNILNASERGYLDTKIREHFTDGYDGYYVQNPIVSLFGNKELRTADRIFVCQSRFEYPNYAFTIQDGYYQVLKDILSSDLTASDEANINFPPADNSGYHRTDPTLLLTGGCVGSYIGGEMGCIDGYR